MAIPGMFQGLVGIHKPMYAGLSGKENPRVIGTWDRTPLRAALPLNLVAPA